MKKLILLLMAAGLFAACDSDSKEKDKYDREKTTADGREKDDYRSGDKANTDSRKPLVNDDNSNLGSKTSTDESDNGETLGGWPQNQRKAFMKSCERKAMESGSDRLTAQSFCQCMLDKMEARYPDFKVAAKLTEEQVNQFGAQNRADCLEEH